MLQYVSPSPAVHEAVSPSPSVSVARVTACRAAAASSLSVMVTRRTLTPSSGAAVVSSSPEQPVSPASTMPPSIHTVNKVFLLFRSLAIYEKFMFNSSLITFFS